MTRGSNAILTAISRLRLFTHMMTYTGYVNCTLTMMHYSNNYS